MSKGNTKKIWYHGSYWSKKIFNDFSKLFKGCVLLLKTIEADASILTSFKLSFDWGAEDFSLLANN
uniref:Uncharacterized protein n=1 Tax=Romanomermis culicivorax TaxID=13658 RepID=A0A915K8D7_ROMCU